MSEGIGCESQNLQNHKKSFNKKKWQEQRYCRKAKVQKWENIKRKQAKRQFIKELKKVGMNFESKKAVKKYKENKSFDTFKKAEMKYAEIQTIKEEKIKKQKKLKEEKREAVMAYKEKKAIRFRKLSQKTKKGQPLMRTRIELLLEKIQKDYCQL